MTSLTASTVPTDTEAERLAQQATAIEEAWKNLFPLRLKGQGRPFESQPYLFLAAFPQLKRHDAEVVAIAGRLFLNSMLVQDEILDRSLAPLQAVTETLRAEAMRFEAFQLLYKIFPPQTEFWKRFRRYLVDHAEACIEERRFADGLRPWSEYTEALSLAIARGKNSVAQTTIAALVEMAGDDALQEPLASSVLLHYTAFQLWDDLCDWKEDLQAGVPSLLLSRILHEQPPAAEREKLTKQLASDIYYGGHAEYVLDLAMDLLDEADRKVATLEHLAWREVLARLRSTCTEFRRDIERIVESNLRRAKDRPDFRLELPKARETWQSLAWDALTSVVEQWKRGFGEARHIMYLARADGFIAASEFHFGDVFQRALIADALCDADELLGGSLGPVIEHEARYLLSRRDTTGVGSWRYFQTVSESAPDADDLGQVMQVLVRAGLRAEVESTCEGPLDLLLRELARDDGAVETWLIPAWNRTSEQERQVRFNEEKWGSGPDNEVVANLLYALVLYDPERFRETIARGIDWLEARQESEGSWSSTWYYGPFYGTYVCLRLLAAARPCSRSIPAAQTFLKSRQRADGAWGFEAESEPLSTAFAVLGLCTLRTTGTPSAAVDRALVYLAGVLAENGSWPQVPFIKPRQNDPYGSRTITAAYVLKATIAAGSIPRMPYPGKDVRPARPPLAAPAVR